MKKVLFICLVLLIFALGIRMVYAKETSVFTSGEIQYLADPLDPDDICKSMFGNPDNPEHVAYYLQVVLEIIKYLGIVICIVLTTVDMAKALFSDDKDMMKSSFKKGFNRIIYAVVLFFLPIIVKTIMLLIGGYTSCGIK